MKNEGIRNTSTTSVGLHRSGLSIPRSSVLIFANTRINVKVEIALMVSRRSVEKHGEFLTGEAMSQYYKTSIPPGVGL